VTAGEHHSKLSVLDFLFRNGFLPARLFPKPQEVGKFGRGEFETAVAADKVNGPVAGGPHEPGRGVVGHPLERPNLQGLDQRVLHHVFRQVEPAKAENAG
jgi:hypothetical protein